MRDFRDAKAMARSLRDALTAKSVQTTHSESLELIAKAFGYDNWNILSAKIEAVPSPSKAASVAEAAPATGPVTFDEARTLAEAKQNWPGRLENPESLTDVLYCSFCGKNQHEVNKLVAGPAVFICDECIDLCTDIVDEQLLRLFEGDKEGARAMSIDRLRHYVEHTEKGVQRNRLVLQRIESVLALRESASVADGEMALSPSFAQLKEKTPDELRAMQAYPQAQLKSYEQALRTATAVVQERSKAD
jgi:hypothetical protein